MSTIQLPEELRETEYKYGWRDRDTAGATAKKGLNEDIIREISALKNEPEWMLETRLKAYKKFLSKPMPEWGADLSGIDFDNIKYFVKSTEGVSSDWRDLPEEILETYEKLGIPEAERERLVAGVTAQFESEAVYHKVQSDLSDAGVIFMDTDTALKEHPELFKKYFGKIISSGDNKFAALNTAVWSGGSFVYIPKGVKVEIPLQTYFRINTENMGQFERTLIIVEEGASVSYYEGCTAALYSSQSLHSAVVEIIVKKDAHCEYSTIQNWSNNVYNLVTKRAVAYENSFMKWSDANLGSSHTMKYPAVYLLGEGARGEVLSAAMASTGQHLDTGAKMVHAASNTSSNIISKSISRKSGRSSYRGLVEVQEGAESCRSHIECDALLLDELSISDTYPYMSISQKDAVIEHEASVSKVSDRQKFYLMSRGLTEEQATSMIVNGFIEEIVKEFLPEYAVELTRLIELQMDGSIG